jgi:hypothetical protein
MILSGVPLFLSEAIKCYYHFAFWTKMTALVLAIVFTFAIRRAVSFAPDGRFSPASYRAVGITSIAVWSTSAAAAAALGCPTRVVATGAIGRLKQR